MRALGFEPKKEEIQKMIQDVRRAIQPLCLVALLHHKILEFHFSEANLS